MTSKITQLEAAVKVLVDAKRPMHYEQVAKLTVAKGLISSESPNFSINIGSILNREVNNNPSASIKKVRVGVFEAKKR